MELCSLKLQPDRCRTGVNRLLRFSLAVVVLAASNSLSEAQSDRFTALDGYVEKSLKQWDLPGAAVAVIRGGQVVHPKAYGVLSLGEERRVTPTTLFPLGSVTKSFTASAIGILVDEGKLSWDDPVTSHLPELEFCNPWLTQEITIRDLLAHRTGLESGNLLWSKNDFGADEILRRLKYLRVDTGFRSRFVYNNLMYLVAGKVIERVSGDTWAQFIETRLLRPTGMKTSITSTPDRGDFAKPHVRRDKQGIDFEFERHYSDSIAPAGAIWANLEETAKWVQWNLGNEAGVSPKTLHELHSPQIVLPVGRGSGVYPKPMGRAYALGWFVDFERGAKVVYHAGGRNGYIVWVTLLPEMNSGFVILANRHQTGFNLALHHWLLDAFLDRPEKDWSAILSKQYRDGWQRILREAEAGWRSERDKSGQPERSFTAYVGRYRNRLFGDLIIEENGDGLVLRFGPRRVSQLQFHRGDSFLTTFKNPYVENWGVTFGVDEEGNVSSLEAREAPWAPDGYEDSTDLGRFERVDESE